MDARLEKAAQRNRVSKGEWVRKALEESLLPGKFRAKTYADPVARLAALHSPVSDIDPDAGRNRSRRAPIVFIDSNIPMYVAGADHPNREPSRKFLDRVRSGKVDACTSTEVLQEILYLLPGP